MGTIGRVRTRKYHGFFMGVAGRSETAFLLDLEIHCNGVSLWPHAYLSHHGKVESPTAKARFTYLGGEPCWIWVLPDGVLKMRVRALSDGVALSWHWVAQGRSSKNKGGRSSKNLPARLELRGLWGMRPLHAMGGFEWTWQVSEGSSQAHVVGPRGQEASCELLGGPWFWQEDPQWYRNFHYSEERQRGYPAEEDLFSAGVLQIDLASQAACSWKLGTGKSEIFRKKRTGSLDFILQSPPGIVAGYPWFGEWGRDTFVSLPGIACSHPGLESWALDLLRYWGNWIQKEGMLPNILSQKGGPQWESADATLWWCHSLASLWAFSLSRPFMPTLREEMGPLLGQAISAIRNGVHRFLRETSEGLLEVSTPHTTWMDARVDDRAVTPRLGILPEINALWFEARCLHWLWSDSACVEELEEMGKRILKIKEENRPNGVFLHSITLAPSFVLRDWNGLRDEVFRLMRGYWTPVGLRSLSSDDPRYHSVYQGNQRERDLAYHQGPVWGWLGGHFNMAIRRFKSHDRTPNNDHSIGQEVFSSTVLRKMPLKSHISEIFDADPPWTPRGAPAQAWSLACLEEARAQKRWRVDDGISRILAQRWLGRQERNRQFREKEGPGIEK